MSAATTRTVSTLTTNDLKNLAASYITPEIAEDAGIYRVDSVEGAAKVSAKSKRGEDYSGLIFPYRMPESTKDRIYRLRRDTPTLEKQSDGSVKETKKYLSSGYDRNDFYFSPEAKDDWLKNTSIKVVFVEGEKKTLALQRYFVECHEQILVIGLAGVWNWKGRNGKAINNAGKSQATTGAINDFDHIQWQKREVEIIFDADAASNQQVKNARTGLMKELTGRGAIVRILEMPDVAQTECKGIDDLLGAKGADFVTGWLQTARQQSTGNKRQTTKSGSYTFEAKPDGVFAKDSDGNEHMICSPLWIEAMTRDERNANWGRLLRFIDPDGKEHQWAMPASLRAGQRGEYEAFLADQGVNVFNPKLLHTYLAGQSDKRVLVVSRTGWHRGVFVFADDCIGSDDGEAIFHQSPEGGNHLMQQAGTLDEWKSEVARYCSGNSRLTLAVSAGFAASLLGKLNLQGAGFHFRSSTSKGKTTALLVGGSVWGGGTDKGFLRRWRATINGIESLAESHNDAMLCLDELAEVDPRQAGETAYMLANGQAKMRQNKIGGLRKVAEWRTLFLSSGEISLADHLKDGGKRIRGGMEVRLIDLPADAEKGFGLFEDLHEMDSAKALADHLQQASKRYFGTPIRAFIKELVTQPESELMAAWQCVKAAFLTTNLPVDAKEEAGRVADYFALVGFAGEAATEAGITGWNEGDAINAASQMFKEWLAGRGTGSSDEDAAIRQIRLFLEQHSDSRFRKLGIEACGIEQRTIQNQAGCREIVTDEDGGESVVWYVSPEVFRSEVCKGFDWKSVAKALDSKNFLIKNHGCQFKRRDPESKATSAFYAISSAIFEGE